MTAENKAKLVMVSSQLCRKVDRVCARQYRKGRPRLWLCCIALNKTEHHCYKTNHMSTAAISFTCSSGLGNRGRKEG